MRKLLASALAALVLPVAAEATPPPNDNRVDATPIATFPATIAGTTAEATVERLDPQLSECGRVEASVWFRIDAAPDGLIVVSVKAAAGMTPIVRVYQRERSGIDELDCGSAAAGGLASASFETVRGSGYLVLVGRRPGTADGTFAMTAELFLPPANDRSSGASPLRRLPSTVRGTTLGATGDDSDPDRCDLQGGTVWYRLRVQAERRVVLRLAAGGDLDAALVVVERIRSRRTAVTCGRTDSRGTATASFVPRRGASYFVVVGHQEDSGPGTFTLQGLAAEPAERLPGRALPPGGARSTVHGLTDVNDIWYVELRPGRTVKLRVTSPRGCPRVAVRRSSGGSPFALACNDVRWFTPEPNAGGRYVLEIEPGEPLRTQSYALRVVPAGNDDLGVGNALPNARTTRGSLSTGALDVVDLYHFDVARTSDVRVALGRSGATTLTVLRDSGARVGDGRLVQRRLRAGRYVVAVRSRGTGGSYAVSLLVRQITQTTLIVGDALPATGQPVTLATRVVPAAGGRVELRIDRFDPLTGWHFHRMYRVAAGATVSWTPAAAGRWRVRATFLGTIGASPSRSRPVRIEVGLPEPV